MTSHVVYNILTNWKIIYIFKITGWNHMKLRLLIWRKLIWRKSSSCWTNRQRPLIWRKSLTSSCYNSNSIVPRKNVSLKKSSLSDIVGFATALDFSLELFKLVKICSSCNNSKLFQTIPNNSKPKRKINLIFEIKRSGILLFTAATVRLARCSPV